ncbi:MAG: flagellar basal body-associated FliL family protein [Desulfobulbaceae bacterium]|nr:flagellar basal body-associated FliL family protein [Desulfobulbaceae bacterium]HIJ77724.1 flagellar basal body-associated FliL family protein [Deltaproteobacteria bacterium]
MANDKIPTDEELSSQPAADSGKENDWGDDWESAFQAEDDMFFSEEGEEGEDDFFLDEEGAHGAKGSSSLDSTLPLKQSPTGPVTQEAVTGDAATPSLKAALVTLFIAIKTATAKQLHRLQALPVYFRYPTYVLLALLGVALILLISQPPAPDNDLAKLQATADLNQEAAIPEATLPSQIDENLPLEQTIPEQTRKKWIFSPFFIPVHSQQNDQALTFVLVDITLVTMMDEKEELPADKKPFVRDIIYQFYKNRPLEELHRFSLARGEMNRKLKAWLQKQWPEGPIESIIFTRYRLS